MQEHEQLQKLMLQARSSVRRSSLKDQTNPDSDIPGENANVDEQREKTAATTGEASAIPSEKTVTIKKEPLTEKDLFRENSSASKNENKKPPLTEKDLFPERTSDVSLMDASQKSSMVKVIFPDQNIAATIAQRNTDAGESNDSFSSVPEEASVQNEHVDISEEYSAPYDAELHAKKRTHTKAAISILVSVVLLIGLGSYYFFYIHQPQNFSTAKQNNAPAQSTNHSTQTPTHQGNAPVQNTTQSKPDVVQQPENKQAAERNIQAEAGNAVAAQKKSTETPVVANESLGKYKVISKAYFHDAPDESTRRKAFIIHWNNAVLTPLEEKNGFVYIVFTNHLGQTSKGWLRKQDLMRIE